MQMSGMDNVPDAVESLGLMTAPIRSVALACELDWHPGGAETYIYRFSVTSRQETRNFVLKAVTAMSSTGSVGALADVWLSRRKRLQSAGVSTPKLYALHRATMLEEYIPYSLSEALQLESSDAIEFKRKCAQLAGRVVKAGFRPVSLFHDLRSRGQDVVMIDFGADLGGLFNEEDGSAALIALEEFARSQGWKLSEGDREMVMTGGEVAR